MSTFPIEEIHRGILVAQVFSISHVPTVDTGIYADGDVLFTDMPLAAVARENGGIVTLTSICLRDMGKQNAEFDIFFFGIEPATGTYTINVAFTLHDTDSTLFVGHVSFTEDEYADAAASSVATLTNINLQMECITNDDLYVIGVSRDTPTYASAADLLITYNFIQD